MLKVKTYDNQYISNILLGTVRIGSKKQEYKRERRTNKNNKNSKQSQS